MKCAVRTIKYLLNRLFGCDGDRACLSASDIKHIIHIKTVWNKSDAGRRIDDSTAMLVDIGILFIIFILKYIVFITTA